MEYIGVDIGKKKCVICAMNQDGSVDELSSYPNTSFDASQVAKRLVERYGGGGCKAVVESTANLWLKTYEAFESAGIDIRLANPSKTRLIAEAKIKTDRLDAKVLARLLRGDLIAECYVPSKETRLARALLGHRTNVLREQTKTKNRIHSLLDKYELECEYDNIFGVHGMEWLHSIKVDGHDNEILQSFLRQMEFLKREEETADSSIASDALHNTYVPTIMSMTGFNYFSASVIATCIADISRFPSPSHLVSWVGMCPSVHQTGQTLYMGKMKDGNKRAQWIMTEVANAAALHDPRMSAYYQRIAKRHHHNVAITHVANKMLRILWHMLTEKRLYNERRNELYALKLKRLAIAAT